MSVYTQPNSPFWLIEVTDSTGKVRRRSSKVPHLGKKANRRAAEKKEEEFKRELEASADHTSMTLAEALERYGNTVIKLGTSDGSNYVYTVKRLCEGLGYQTPLEALTASVIHGWRDSLLTGGLRKWAADGTRTRVTDKREGLKPSSINFYMRILRTVLRKAHFEWHTLPKLPQIKLLKGAKKRVRYLKDAEEARLLLASPPHLRQLLVFLIGTGARKTEALSLPWDNIENCRRGANARAVVTFEHNPDKGLFTKSGLTRRVPITNQLRDFLADMRDAQRAAGYDGDLVFAYNHKGRKVDGEPTWWGPLGDPQAAFETARKAAKLGKDVVIHTMRHTFASRLVMDGESLLNVRDLLGHTDIATTQIYSHLAPSALEATIARMEARLASKAAA